MEIEFPGSAAPDDILFAVDWPHIMNPPTVGRFRDVPLSDIDKAKILGGTRSGC